VPVTLVEQTQMEEWQEPGLVVAVEASAMFNLTGAQEAMGHRNPRVPLAPGSAFPLVRRLLTLNRHAGGAAVQVVVLSTGDPASQAQLYASLEAHRLPACRIVVASGISCGRQAMALRSSLYLSTNDGNVRDALRHGVPAGCLNPIGVDDDADDELRIAFDFDGVLAADTSERLFQTGGLVAFEENECRLARQPLRGGPLASFCRHLNRFQRQLSGSPWHTDIDCHLTWCAG
jgi:5'-nucleotidase